MRVDDINIDKIKILTYNRSLYYDFKICILSYYYLIMVGDLFSL
jgi:hypothetical protein